MYLLELALPKLTFHYMFYGSCISSTVGQKRGNYSWNSLRRGMHCGHLARLCVCIHVYIYSWKTLMECWERTFYFPSSVTFSFFSSCGMIPATLLSKHTKCPCCLSAQRSQGAIFGEQGTSSHLPPHLLEKQELSAGFARNGSSEKLQTTYSSSFSRPETRRSLRGMAKRRDVILATFCLTKPCSHPQRPKKQQFGSRAQVGRRAWKAGVLTGELILMAIAWWWPLHSNDICKAVMKWCRSLSEFCFLACAGKR